MSLDSAPGASKLKNYNNFLNKARKWAEGENGILRLDPRKPDHFRVLVRGEAAVDNALSKIMTVRRACTKAGAGAASMQAKAEVLYRRIWLALWRVKLMQWRRNQKQQARKNEQDLEGLTQRKWFFRLGTFVLFAGITALFVLYVIPQRLLDFRHALELVLFLLLLGLQYILLALALLFVPWPGRSKIRNHQLTADDGVAFLIASYQSEPDVLEYVLKATKRRFAGNCIFVCCNDNQIGPFKTTKDVCDQMGVNYVHLPEGNKTFAFYWTARYWLSDSFKYVMMIDDDVAIPHNLEVPISRTLADPKVAAIAYTIRAANNTTTKSGRPTKSVTVRYQDLEYVLAGFLKIFQSNTGSTLTAHGAIALWKRDVLIDILNSHNTVFHGEDMQMGLILHKNYRDLRDGPHKIKVIASECVETNVPVSPYYWNPPPGQKSLFTQRVRSWDACAHRFFTAFVEFTLLTLPWPRHTLMLHVFVITEIMTIIQDWLRLYVIFYYAYLAPLQLLGMSLRVLAVQYITFLFFNYFRLANRRDLRQPLWVVITFPAYQLYLVVLRLCSMLYSATMYTATVPNKPKIKYRLDNNEAPPFLSGMEEFVGDWSAIWDLDNLDKLAETDQPVPTEAATTASLPIGTAVQFDDDDTSGLDDSGDLDVGMLAPGAKPPLSSSYQDRPKLTPP